MGKSVELHSPRRSPPTQYCLEARAPLRHGPHLRGPLLALERPEIAILPSRTRTSAIVSLHGVLIRLGQRLVNDLRELKANIRERSNTARPRANSGLTSPAARTVFVLISD